MDRIIVPCYSCSGSLVLYSAEPCFDKKGRLKFFLKIFRCDDCRMEFCFRKLFSENWEGDPNEE